MSQKIRKPDMVMFDWDHTLSVTPLFFDDSHTKDVADFYASIFGDQLVAGHSSIEFAAGLPVFADGQLATIQEMRSFMMPGSMAILDYLLSNEVAMAVVSNKVNFIVNYELSAMDLSHYFCAVVGSGDYSDKKPEPGLLFTAAARCNLPPDSEVWYVGDSLVDMQAANSAGYTSIYYRYSSPVPEESMDYRGFITHYERNMLNGCDWRPDYIIDDLSELLYLFQEAEVPSYVGDFKDK